MELDAATGLLQGIRYRPSPNCDPRPRDAAIDMLLIHGISLPPGEFGGPYIDQLFCNELDPAGHPYFCTIASLRVSSHALIRRDGTIVQYVPFHQRAWHAGQSEFQGRECCNDFSIGIELEGADDLAYTPEQYQSLVQLTRLIMRHWPAITPARIVGHSDIAPGRKTDPGPAFDWTVYKALLAAA